MNFPDHILSPIATTLELKEVLVLRILWIFEEIVRKLRLAYAGGDNDGSQ